MEGVVKMRLDSSEWAPDLGKMGVASGHIRTLPYQIPGGFTLLSS